MNKRWYACGIILVFPLLVTCGRAEETSTVVVRRATIRVSVTGSGSVAPRESAELTLEVPGIVKQVNARKGQNVYQGDRLLSLDPRDAEQAVLEAEANLQAARARVDQEKNGNATDQDLKAAEARLAEKRAHLQEVQTGDATDADKSGAEAMVRNAEANLEKARTANVTAADIRDAAAAVRNAEANLEKVRTGNITDADIQQAEATVRNAEANLERARTGNITDADIRQAEATVRNAEANLERVRTGNVTEADIHKAEAAVRSAQANLDAVKTGPNPVELSAAQQRLTQAQQEFNKVASAASANKTNSEESMKQSAEQVRLAQEAYSKAYWNNETSKSGIDATTGIPYSRLEKLFGSGYVDAQKRKYEDALTAADLHLQQAQSQVEQAKVTYEDAKQKEISDVAIAQSHVDDAQIQLDEVLKGPGEADVAQAQAQLDQANADLRKLQQGGTAADVASAQAQLDQANAALQKLQQGGTPADIASAQAQLDQSNAALKRLKQGGSPADVAAAQAQLDQVRARLDKLRQGGAKADIAAAQAQLDQRAAELAKLDEGASPADIAAAQAQVEQSEAALEQLTASSTSSDLTIAEAAVQEAAARLERAHLNLDKATLYAPFDGIITDVTVSLGDTVNPATTSTVMTLVDTSQLHVDVNISEADVTQLYIGQVAYVNVDALGIDPIRGTLSYIAPVAQVIQNISAYPARVELPQKITSVLAGMNVSVEVGVAEKQDVLVIPAGAIRSDEGQYFVLLKQGDTFVERQVQIGLSNDLETEITRGLQENDIIASVAIRQDIPSTQ